MKRVSQQCHSKPAAWAVDARIQERQLGYRAVQVEAYVHQTLKEEGVYPSYLMIARELGIATKGEVCKIVSRMERRGILNREGSGRDRRIRLP